MYSFLLVDDEPIMREGLKIMLENSDLQIDCIDQASNGEMAITLLSEKHFNFVITDIRMSKLNGLELVKYIYEHYEGINVILLSGYNDFEYAQTAIKYGVKDYLLKPVNSNSLISTVKKIINDDNARIISHYVSLEKTMAILTALEDDIFSPSNGRGVDMFCNVFNNLPPNCYYLFYNDIITNLIKNISSKINEQVSVKTPQDPEKMEKDEILALFKSTIAELSEHMYNRQNNVHFDMLLVVKKYLSENFDKDITLEELAKHVHVNSSYLSHIFKSKTNKGITQYKNELRIEKAIELLRYTTKPISEITSTIGYKDTNYFIKAFKKATGCTPAEYRKLQKENDYEKQ